MGYYQRHVTIYILKLFLCFEEYMTDPMYTIFNP